MRIESKKQMYALFNQGEFGGGPRHWIGMDAVIANPPRVSCIPRYAGEGGKDLPGYGANTAPDELLPLLRRWISITGEPEKIIVNLAMPDNYLILQGEVMRSSNFLDLRYSFVKAPMRVALATEQYHESGLRALTLLDLHLDESSRELLEHLMDKYDGAVVEFSSYSMLVTDDGRNTVFWEVRHY